MQAFIPLKPISVNDAYRGRRYKTKQLAQFKRQAALLCSSLPYTGGDIQIEYIFYLKYPLRSDTDNYIKAMSDVLVEKGVIDDDRYVWRYVAEKRQSETEGIDITILPFPSKKTE